MACKIRCPKCKLILREEGDEMKNSQGEYRVYDSIGRGESKRILFCLSCNHSSHMSEVHKEELIECIPNSFNIIHDKVKSIIKAGPDYELGLNELLHYIEESVEIIKIAFDDE